MCRHCVRAERRTRATKAGLWRLLVAVAGSEDRARALSREEDA